jgi:hypothetical protein
MTVWARRILAIAGLPISLSDVGFRLKDLEWIVRAGMAHEPMFDIPERRTPADTSCWTY